MTASVMFIDCPAYMDEHGAVRCGLPAEVQDRYTMDSSDGPVEGAKIRCPRGHRFNGPVDSLTWKKDQHPAVRDQSVIRAGRQDSRPPAA